MEHLFICMIYKNRAAEWNSLAALFYEFFVYCLKEITNPNPSPTGTGFGFVVFVVGVQYECHFVFLYSS